VPVEEIGVVLRQLEPRGNGEAVVREVEIGERKVLAALDARDAFCS
jgi:hypothetical protein